MIELQEKGLTTSVTVVIVNVQNAHTRRPFSGREKNGNWLLITPFAGTDAWAVSIPGQYERRSTMPVFYRLMRRPTFTNLFLKMGAGLGPCRLQVPALVQCAALPL
jgi:hypothetical protein